MRIKLGDRVMGKIFVCTVQYIIVTGTILENIWRRVQDPVPMVIVKWDNGDKTVEEESCLIKTY